MSFYQTLLALLQLDKDVFNLTDVVNYMKAEKLKFGDVTPPAATLNQGQVKSLILAAIARYEYQINVLKNADHELVREMLNYIQETQPSHYMEGVLSGIIRLRDLSATPLQTSIFRQALSFFVEWMDNNPLTLPQVGSMDLPSFFMNGRNASVHREHFIDMRTVRGPAPGVISVGYLARLYHKIYQVVNEITRNYSVDVLSAASVSDFEALGLELAQPLSQVGDVQMTVAETVMSLVLQKVFKEEGKDKDDERQIIKDSVNMMSICQFVSAVEENDKIKKMFAVSFSEMSGVLQNFMLKFGNRIPTIGHNYFSDVYYDRYFKGPTLKALMFLAAYARENNYFNNESRVNVGFMLADVYLQKMVSESALFSKEKDLLLNGEENNTAFQEYLYSTLIAATNDATTYDFAEKYDYGFSSAMISLNERLKEEQLKALIETMNQPHAPETVFSRVLEKVAEDCFQAADHPSQDKATAVCESFYLTARSIPTRFYCVVDGKKPFSAEGAAKYLPYTGLNEDEMVERLMAAIKRNNISTQDRINRIIKSVLRGVQSKESFLPKFLAKLSERLNYSLFEQVAVLIVNGISRDAIKAFVGEDGWKSLVASFMNRCRKDHLGFLSGQPMERLTASSENKDNLTYYDYLYFLGISLNSEADGQSLLSGSALSEMSHSLSLGLFLSTSVQKSHTLLNLSQQGEQSLLWLIFLGNAIGATQQQKERLQKNEALDVNAFEDSVKVWMIDQPFQLDKHAHFSLNRVAELWQLARVALNQYMDAYVAEMIVAEMMSTQGSKTREEWKAQYLNKHLTDILDELLRAVPELNQSYQLNEALLYFMLVGGFAHRIEFSMEPYRVKLLELLKMHEFLSLALYQKMILDQTCFMTHVMQVSETHDTLIVTDEYRAMCELLKKAPVLLETRSALKLLIDQGAANLHQVIAYLALDKTLDDFTFDDLAKQYLNALGDEGGQASAALIQVLKLLSDENVQYLKNRLSQFILLRDEELKGTIKAAINNPLEQDRHLMLRIIKAGKTTCEPKNTGHYKRFVSCFFDQLELAAIQACFPLDGSKPTEVRQSWTGLFQSTASLGRSTFSQFPSFMRKK